MDSQKASNSASLDDLGPVIATGKTNHGVAILVAACGVFLLVFGGLTLVQGADTRPPVVVTVLLFAAGLITAAIGGWLFWRKRGLITLHERGLRRNVAGNDITMRFDEADQVAYYMTRIYMNGVYSATDEKITLKSDGPDAKVVHFQRRFRDPQQTAGPSPISPFVEPVIVRLAAKNAEKLARGEAVPWFPGAMIHDWGVELPNGWGGKIPIRWDELEAPEIVNRQCHLRRVGKSAPIATVFTFLMNFYPGLEVVKARRAALK
jgi:hypothetical protein